jgi:hypothetical protein
MSNTLRLIVVIVLIAVALSMVTRGFSQRQHPKADPRLYHVLRGQIFHVRREQIGLPAPAHDTDPWAVVMDWGMTEGSATVVAIADGTASIYLSSGGGSIGGGQSHDSIRQAAMRAVSVAAEFQPEMRRVTSYPLPGSGEVVFYVLTDAGVFSASASEKELSAHRPRLSKLGDALQEIMTQYCLIQTAK